MGLDGVLLQLVLVKVVGQVVGHRRLCLSNFVKHFLPELVLELQQLVLP